MASRVVHNLAVPNKMGPGAASRHGSASIDASVRRGGFGDEEISFPPIKLLLLNRPRSYSICATIILVAFVS